jgi:hypothetical protein
MYRHPKSSFLEIRGANKNPRQSQSSFLFNSLCKDTFKVRGKVLEANMKKKISVKNYSMFYFHYCIRSSRENVDRYEDSNVSRVDIVLASNIGIALIAPHEVSGQALSL